MYAGLTLSILLHGALLAWALVSFDATKPLEPPELEPVEVAIVSPDELVRLRKGVRSSKKLETQAAKSQERPTPKTAKTQREPPPPPPPSAAASPPPPPDDALAAKPKDDIASKLASLQKTNAELEAKLKAAAAQEKAAAERRKAEDAAAKAKAKEALAARRKAEADAEARKKAEAKKRAEAEKARRQADAEKKRKEQAEKEQRRKRLAEKRRRDRERADARRRAEARKKRQTEAERRSALLNMVPDARTPPSGSEWTAKTERPLPKGPAAGAAEGRDTRLTASQVSMLNTIVGRGLRPCWILPGGGGGNSRIPVVTLRWKMNIDGTVHGEPVAVGGSGDEMYRLAVAAAQRAVLQCQPIDLPRDLYGYWKTIEREFDPREMQ